MNTKFNVKGTFCYPQSTSEYSFRKKYFVSPMLRIMLEPKPSLIFPHFVHSSYFLDYIAKTHCNCIVGRLVTFGMCIPGKKLLFFLLNFVFISFRFLFVKFLFFHHHLKIFPKGFPNVYHRKREEYYSLLPVSFDDP